MNSDLFAEVMAHFVKYTMSSKENPTLLIFDNHESHLSVKALDIAKENGVIILTLPPHSSHKLQPLDISVFGPFKRFYNDAIQSHLLSHPGTPISIYDVAHCVAIAHERAATPNNSIKLLKMEL